MGDVVGEHAHRSSRAYWTERHAEHELRLVRAVKKAIKSGQKTPSKEEAMELISCSPLVEAVAMMGSEEIGKMFDQKGTGGATLLGKVPLEIVIEYAAEETRETTDFSSLFSRAVSDPYIYDALDGLVKDDAKRPGPPNKSLLDWMACRPDKRPSAKSGQRAQLKWRDALLVWLLNDARTLGFPVEGGRELKTSGAATARDIVREVVSRRLNMNVSTRQLLRIWDNNKERIPELYRQ